MRLVLAAAMATAVASPAAAAPDFTQSTIAVEPATLVEGDVATFRIALRNTGDEDAGAVAVMVEWPVMGFLVGMDGFDAPVVDRATRRIEATTPLARGEARQFALRVLTPRDSAGDSFSVTVRAAHYASGAEHWFHHSVSPDSRLSHEGIPMGGVRVNPVMFVVLLFLVAAVLLAVVASRGERGRRGAHGPGAAVAIVVSLGFWTFFATMAWRDYQSLTSWTSTTCTVAGRRLVASGTTSTSGSRTSGRATSDPTVYEPLLALQYEVGGREMVSSGYDTGSSLRIGGLERRTRELQAWGEGTRVPCWFDPQHPEDVVVHRGFGGAYLFALFPIPVFLLGVALLRRGRRT